ncbi:MAG: glucose 1-dehydrogenase [Armatimonadetes bacterium]|nr:glucose 1-dehydrogenase [Armatimonadota bacterium]
MAQLEGRVAMVTGGSSGIGRGIALELVREGASVAVVDLREEPLRGKYHEQDVTTPTVTEIERLGGRGLFIQADVADDAALAAATDRTVSTFGGLDILVNNAGIYAPGGIEQLLMETWDRITRVNLRAVVVATRLALPHLRHSRAGRIIHIASVQAYGGGSGPAYAPAKVALVNLTRDTAMEVGRYGITVNAICPGYIETAIQDYLTEEQIEACRRRTPLPRFGRPRDIGRAVVFLASDDAEWITGISLVVDGGLLAPV